MVDHKVGQGEKNWSNLGVGELIGRWKEEAKPNQLDLCIWQLDNGGDQNWMMTVATCAKAIKDVGRV